MDHVLRPLTYRDVSGPLVFLAGPIQGAPDWQAEAIRFISEAAPELTIASPRTPPPWHRDFEGQARWEHYHLEQAALHGVILFWLPRESVHDCGRAYAQTSRFELGWMMERHRCHGVRVVVGIEPGFSNERYLRLTLGVHASRIPIFVVLAETCTEAIRLARLCTLREDDVWP